MRNSRDERRSAMLPEIYLHHIRSRAPIRGSRASLKHLAPKIQAQQQVDEQAQNAASRRNENERASLSATPTRCRSASGPLIAMWSNSRSCVRDDRLHQGIGRHSWRRFGGRLRGGRISPDDRLYRRRRHRVARAAVRRCGFRQVGYLPSMGYKFGHLKQISVMVQRSLGPGAPEVP